MFEDYIKDQSDETLRRYYQTLDNFWGGLSLSDEYRALLDAYYGNSYVVSVITSAAIVFKEIARRHYLEKPL